MSLNLHARVRGAIRSINPDVPGWWYQSKGSVLNTDGRQVPAYQPAVAARMQVQPPSARDLRFIDFLQLQGVIRTVFMFSNPQGIVRVNQRGGDLLLFPQSQVRIVNTPVLDDNGRQVVNSQGLPVYSETFVRPPNDAWKVEQPDEQWDVSEGGWTKLFAVLQTDRLYSALDTQGRLTLDSQGRIVRTLS